MNGNKLLPLNIKNTTKDFKTVSKYKMILNSIIYVYSFLKKIKAYVYWLMLLVAVNECIFKVLLSSI